MIAAEVGESDRTEKLDEAFSHSWCESREGRGGQGVEASGLLKVMV